MYSIVSDTQLFWRTVERYEEHQYIQIGFFQNKVIIECLQIYTTHRDLFESYTVYGINNGENEEEISIISPKPEDFYDDGDTLIIYNYDIINKNPWNNIKIVPNGMRAGNDYRFSVRKLELFGYFITNNCRVPSIKANSILLSFLKASIFSCIIMNRKTF